MIIRIVADIVREEDGSPIPNALVQLDVLDAAECDSAATFVARTDAAGRACIEADAPSGSKWGALNVRARGRGPNADAFTKPVRFTKKLHHRSIALPPGITVSGIVRDESGSTVEGAIVAVVARSGSRVFETRRGNIVGAPPGPHPFRYEIHDDVRTGAAGEFELLDIEIPTRDFLDFGKAQFGSSTPALFLVVAHPNHPILEKGGLLERAADSAGHVVFDVVLRSASALRGRVTDESGRAVHGAVVDVKPVLERAYRPFVLQSGFEGRSTRTDERGEFEVPGLDPRAEHSVEVLATGFSRWTRKFDAIDSKPLEVVLGAGGILAGIVIDEAKTPIEIGLSLMTREHRFVARARADGSGRFEFAGIPRDLEEGILDVACRSIPVRLPARDVEIRLRGETVAVAVSLIDARTREPIPVAPRAGGSRPNPLLENWGNLWQGGCAHGVHFEGPGAPWTFLTPTGLGRIGIRVRGYRAVELEFDATRFENGGTIEVELEKGLVFVGLVRGAEGEPLTGARLRLLPPGRFVSSESVTDGQGGFHLDGVAGDEVCVVEHPNHAAVVTPLASFGTVREGVISSEIQLRGGATITGFVRLADDSPAAGSVVLLEHPEGDTILDLPTATVKADGSYRIDHVPQYELVLRVGNETRPVALLDGEALVADFVLPK